MKMSKKKAIIFVLVALLTVTSVAYAILSTTLNITGTVTKKGGDWNVYFTNLSTPTLTGGATVSNAKLEASSFTFNALLVKPLDSIVYTFDVTNKGTINAKLSSITLTGEDTANNNNITYTLTYADGKPIAKDDTLNVDAVKTLKLTVTYNDASSISATDVALNLGATLIYVQA